MKQIVYLIDGSAYIYRAYHAVTPLTNSKGVHTHAVFGFVNIVRRLLREKTPDYLMVAFDARGKVFRHEMYPEYKANRPAMPADLAEQIPFIKQYVEAARLVVLEEPGVEADDIIASAAKCLKAQGHEVVIVSGDKDLLQLVDDRVSMWNPMKDEVMDPAAVTAKYQVAPESLLDFFALVGDSSDNVPGVPGVGPKTAAKLINEYQSLEGIYREIETMKKSKVKERLVAHRNAAFMSRDLIRLKEDVAVPTEIAAYQLQEADDAALVALYRELEFTSLLKGVVTAKPVPSDGFTLVTDAAELERVVSVLMAAGRVVVDTETTSLDARKARLVGVSLCSESDVAWYVPCGHLREDGSRVEGQLDEKVVQEILSPLLLAKEVTKIGHNLKYDYTVFLKQWGVALAGQLVDTMVAAHLLEVPGRSLKLDDLCLANDLQLTSFEQVVAGDKREDCFAYVGLETACTYSCEDVYGTLMLWENFAGELEEKELDNLFYTVEMAVLPLLAAMEIRGICVAEGVLAELSEEFAARLGEYEKDIYTLAGEEFNINSPKQLGQILFEKLELPHGRKTKTGYSTDVKVLQKLARKHDLPAQVLEYRTLTKLQSTYVEKLAALRDPKTGRIHTSFNQAITATGRLSSSNPNLQNIPIRTEEGNRIRKAFVPAAGMVFVAADYSQIDLRVMAHYSQDKTLLTAFRNGADIHSATAAQVFGVAPLLITSEMRRVAKSINFGIVYGMSSFGLSEQLNIPRREAQNFIDRYFAHYPGVKKFMGDIVEQARENGYVTTLLNRRRELPEIHAKNKVRRDVAERAAINTPIQGTAADIIKLAMLAVEKELAASGLNARLLLQIHDELVFEVAEEEAEQAQECICAAMEKAMPLDVPLVAHGVISRSLAKDET